MRLHPRLMLIMLAAALSVEFVFSPRASASEPPELDAPIYATYVAGALTLTGQGFGAGGASSAVRFTYEGNTLDVAATDTAVDAWSDTSVQLSIPGAVHSGQVSVVTDGAESASAVLEVFEYDVVDSPDPNGPSKPLALAVGSDGRLWMNEEGHGHLEVLTPGTPSTGVQITVPQAQGAGIFAWGYDGNDAPARNTVLGEDVDIASDGSVWFTEGGSYLYTGVFRNTSRIVRYDPSDNEFNCYNVPADDAEVMGVLIDETRGMVWYAASDFVNGNAIGGFVPATTPNDCLWDPLGGERPVVCSAEQTIGCHQMYALPRTFTSPAHLAMDGLGLIWFTEYWRNSVGRLDPDDGSVVEIPLPASIVRAGPGIYSGSGPWEIFIEGSDLWITEYFDATVTRIRTSLMDSNDCTVLNPAGQNPCVDELFVGSNGTDLSTIHTLTPGTDGRVWFSLASLAGTRPAFIDTAHDDAVVLLPILSDVREITGIVQDASSGAVWLAQFFDQRIGRLRVASGDADGLYGTSDNCPDAYNPAQENHDRNFTDLRSHGRPFDDKTLPASDEMGDACDTDADNDGLLNVDEEMFPIAECPSATAALDPLDRDTDDDNVLDGAECVLGSNPAASNSRPLRFPAGDADRDGLTNVFEATIGTNPGELDTDDDRIGDGNEFKYFGTNPLMVNGDGDVCADGKEVASVNADHWVNSADLLITARSFGSAGSAAYVANFDLDRNGVVNATDLAVVATLYGICK